MQKDMSVHQVTLVYHSILVLLLQVPSTDTSHYKRDSTLQASVMVNLQETVFVTDGRFLSLGIDSSLIRHRWQTFDFNSDCLKTLARSLSPAYMRLMGTDGDRMIFVNLGDQARDDPFPKGRFNMTSQDWDNINRFAAGVGWRILFGINVQLRHINADNTSSWNPQNTIELLNYSIKKGYYRNLDFEFGNEPNLWKISKGFLPVKPEQYAKDFKYFRHLLDTQFSAYFKHSLLVGPSTAGVDTTYISTFLNDTCCNQVSAVTWHFYNGGNGLRYVNNYTDPHLLDKYIDRVNDMRNIRRTSKQPGIKLWQGETSSTSSNPGNGIDETYVASFMLLDRLGVSARLGVDVMVRQTFYGLWFALVDNDLNPRPNYWLCLLYKRLVGRPVLNTQIEMNMVGDKASRLRGYAHCTSNTSGYPPGSIVIYIMNLYPVDITLNFKGSLVGQRIDQYLLTPPGGNLTSTQVMLNGGVLKMVNNQTVPKLEPKLLTPLQKAVLPSETYAYYVFPNVNSKACL